MEGILASGFDSLRRNVSDQWSDYEDRIRQEPRKAVATAVVAGYLLRLIPVGAILGGVIRLLLVLARPAALILGAAKLYEFVQARAGEPSMLRAGQSPSDSLS